MRVRLEQAFARHPSDLGEHCVTRMGADRVVECDPGAVRRITKAVEDSAAEPAARGLEMACVAARLRLATEHRHRLQAKPVRVCGTARGSGTRRSAVPRATQIVAPRSMSACAQAAAASGGTKPSAVDWSAFGAVGSGPIARSSTRRMFVSSGATGRSNANARTARAVYGPTPGQGGQRLERVGHAAAVVLDDPDRRRAEGDRPAVVAEPAPRPDDGRRRDRGERGRRRERRDEPLPRLRGASRLRLLRDDLGDEDRPRVARPPEREVAAVRRVPVEDGALDLAEAHRQRYGGEPRIWRRDQLPLLIITCLMNV